MAKTVKDIFFATINKGNEEDIKQKEKTRVFIEKAQAVHGDKYDYSKAEYKNAHTKVCIICPIHGEFWQTPNSHLNGKGCKKCAIDYTRKLESKTTDTFIAEACRIHNNKYDYSKAEYKGARVPICIICPEHGKFWQTPDNHLRGEECPICKGKKHYDTQSFINKANIVHHNKYEYEKTHFINTSTKVIITCRIHGDFEQAAGSHLMGCGCPKCAGENMNTASFVERAKQTHGNKYDYSKTEYKNAKTKVCIICPEHGKFWQIPYNHFKGSGCPYCGGSKQKNTSQFIRDAISIHGDKYDYSKVEYRNANTKVCIICPKHGEFWQTPTKHLSNKGCPECGVISTSLRFRKPLDVFIKQAISIHGNFYDYSKVDYINTDTKVCIRCPKHGEFWQTPNTHLAGGGCPRCNNSRLENRVDQLLENMNIDFVTQKRFEWLKSTQSMSLDFYIPDKKIAIECQGRQHFESIDYFGGEDAFKKSCDRDDLKNRLCKEYGIKILYFAEDKEYITDYRYDVITDIDELIAIIKKEKAA